MKARLIALAGLLLLASCAKEKPIDPVSPQGKQVTIRVSMPDGASRVSFTPEGDKLALAWEEGDCIRVISGSSSSVFTVSRIISAHEAEFTGTEVTGSTFDILCPGTYATVEEAEADAGTPAQNGNGSTAHLRFKAALGGVDTYTEIAFTKSWADAHGGSFREAAALKLTAKLPEGVTTLKRAALRIEGVDYTLPLENVDVSGDGQVLTAYLMLPWEEVFLSEGSKLPVYVTDAADEVYSAVLTISGDRTILGGKVNSITGVKLDLQDFAGGDGTQANPYLIANGRHLNNIHKTGILESETIKYFQLVDDVDASGLGNWAPFNSAAPFDKGIDLDGKGHVISGLKSSGVSYASFAGVLYGSLSNVTFSGATINASSKSGVVAGFLGTTQNDYSRVATCTNVTVAGSTVTSTAAAGGFAGHVRGKGAVTGCKVVNTTVNGTSHLGGFAAIADISGIDKYEVPAIFTACEVEGVTLNQNQTSASTAIYTGGFIGESYQAHSFIDCKVKGTTINATQAAVQNIGGFVGYTGYAGANFVRCEVDDATTITANGGSTGGFVGYTTTSDAYTSCSTAATVNVQASSVGGFAGYASGSAAFSDCVATGNVTGQRFTAGFAGVAENVAFLDCRYTSGTITAATTNTNSRVGGFVGSCISGVSFNGCYVSDARVSASGAGRIGGFAGQLGNSSGGGNNVTTSQCYVQNTSISGGINTGGFSGVQYETTSQCYVSGGSVTAGGNNCGGFTGFIQNGDIRNCYTTASVSGGSYSPVGGFVGIAYATDISYSYAAGSVSGSSENVASFVGQCALQGSTVASFSHCIGWNATLPFWASNEVGATFTDVYSGNEGTVSAQATAQTWPTTVWNLTGDLPVLLSVPARIPAIFVGDSITWQWARTNTSFAESNLKIPFDASYMTRSGSNVVVPFHPGFFAGNGYIDKGISGQNTTQMLSRFRKDVVDLNPKVVVIMGGTNDLAQGVTKQQIVDNIAAMAEMADAAGIKVVLCTVTPNNDTYSRLSDPKTKGAHIITLNGMLEDYAASKGFAWCDYWSALVADDGLSLREEYRLYDNLHPGPVGYSVMEPIIKPLIDSLL